MEGATARLSDVPVPVRDVWNPDTCPASLLPWLAFAFSVDSWNTDWTEAQKRQVIRDSVFVHRHKGTLGAVRRALSSLGLQAEVIEWFDKVPAGAPYTFSVSVDVTDSAVSDETFEQARSVIMRTKNLRSHLSALNMRGSVRGSIYAGACVVSGIETTIYPAIAREAEVISPLYFAAAEQCADTVDIYPES